METDAGQSATHVLWAPPIPAYEQQTSPGGQSADSSHWAKIPLLTVVQFDWFAWHAVLEIVQQQAPGLTGHSPSAPHVTVGLPQLPFPSQTCARSAIPWNSPQYVFAGASTNGQSAAALH